MLKVFTMMFLRLHHLPFMSVKMNKISYFSSIVGSRAALHASQPTSEFSFDDQCPQRGRFIISIV
jgi:hypothetical protein